MYNLIPLILILISLSTIIVIVVRKFSVLANLNIETIQAEKEARFKEQILSNRIKRFYYKYIGKLLKIIRPAGDVIRNFFIWSYKKLKEFKENYNKELETESASQQKIKLMLAEAEEMVKNGKLNEAEENYIDIIRLDSKNYSAFKELGKLYFERKDFSEAKQTIEHALKLIDQESLALNQESAAAGITGNGATGKIQNTNIETACLYFELTSVCQAMGNLEGTQDNINKALSIEPNNPRYLDTKLEISIIKKDKLAALDALEKLRNVNPDNQKLLEFEQKIKEL